MRVLRTLASLCGRALQRLGLFLVAWSSRGAGPVETAMPLDHFPKQDRTATPTVPHGNAEFNAEQNAEYNAEYDAEHNHKTEKPEESEEGSWVDQWGLTDSSDEGSEHASDTNAESSHTNAESDVTERSEVDAISDAADEQGRIHAQAAQWQTYEPEEEEEQEDSDDGDDTD